MNQPRTEHNRALAAPVVQGLSVISDSRSIWRTLKEQVCRSSVLLVVLICVCCGAAPTAAFANPNPPQFSEPAGTYPGPLSITITDPKSSSATIYYTTDNSTPTTSSPLYSSPISIPVGTTTLKAVAYNNGNYSTVTSAVYTVTYPTITVTASSGVTINPHDYGANNIWYYVPSGYFYTSGAGTGSFVSSLTSNAGITYLRFPGGFESESYQWYTQSPIYPFGPDWSMNTLDHTYGHYTTNVGATPDQVTAAMGAGNESFVVRTEDAVKAYVQSADTVTVSEWAGVAGTVVAKYCPASGGGVKDWQIGNEWYNTNKASQSQADYDAVIAAYAQVIFYYAQSMESAAATAGCSINIYVTSNWASPYSTDGDMSVLKSDVTAISAAASPWNNSGTTVWANDVTGTDIHIYTGVNPSMTKTYPPPAISSIPTIIANIKTDSGKSAVYVSEWAPDLEDNNNYGGLQDANTIMQMMGQMAQSGITQAAYWPPTFLETQAQADTITLLSNTTSTSPPCNTYNCTTPPYTVDADGQAMQMLSSNYLGKSLATSSTSSYTQSIAALNSSNQIVVFLMTNGAPLTETDLVNISGGPSWTKVDSAKVLYAGAGQYDNKGIATLASIPTSLFTVNPGVSVTVPLNLGTSGLGGPWEIIELVLGN